MINSLAAMSQTRRAYDHRIREQVVRTGIRCLPRHLAIPRSTVGTWRRRGVRPAVCADIPHKGVRKSGMPNIIEVLAGLVSHDG
jgi:hypothetical protein